MLNMAEATTGEDIAQFIVETGKDAVGTYHILTGHEGMGLCFWCGVGLVGRQKRYCKHNAHWREYWRHFSWGFARDWCLERYDNRCANFRHVHSPYSPALALEVHHIIPLEGHDRIWTPYNLPWNLIVLDHWCHVELHAAMRPPKLKLPPPPSADLQIAHGQLALAL